MASLTLVPIAFSCRRRAASLRLAAAGGRGWGRGRGQVRPNVPVGAARRATAAEAAGDDPLATGPASGEEPEPGKSSGVSWAVLLAAPLLAAPAVAYVIPGIVGDDTLREGFVSSLLLIFFSEIGDKTFFIALLLALQNSRAAVFTGTYSALAVMTFISVGLGRVFHEIDEVLPASGIPFDDYAAIGLLLFFGAKTIYDANQESPEDADGEEAEAKKEVERFEAPGAAAAFVASTFALVFAAEWGDKSFLATIALAASSSPIGVIGGALVGHGVATALAVLGGQLLAEKVGVSERVLGNLGGSLFILFALSTAFDVARGAQ